MAGTLINYGNVVSGSNALPTGVNTTYFYARWSGCLVPSVSGKYTIGLNYSDGANLYVGNLGMVANLSGTSTANSTLSYVSSGTIELQANNYYDIAVEWQHGSAANYQLQLIWTPPAGTAQLIPLANLTDSSTSITSQLDSSWWNGTSGVWYPVGHHLIDFSNGNHPNKNLANVPDDSSSGRSASRWFYLSSNVAGWYKLGTWVAGTVGDTLRIDYSGGQGFNSAATQQSYATATVRTGNFSTAPNLSGISWFEHGGSTAIVGISAAATGGSTAGGNASWDIYANVAVWTSGHWSFTLTPGSTWTWSGASASNPGSASSTVVVGTGGHILGVGGTGVDNVLDGSTYARTKGAGLTSGYATKTGGGSYTIKGVGDANTLSLDSEIADGTTYLRPKGVNSSHLLTAAGTAPINNSGLTTSTGTILTSTAGSKVITVAAFTLQYGLGQVSYNSGTVTPSAYGTYMVYFSDPTYAGGTVTYLATSAAYNTMSNNAYQAIGTITTSASVGGGGGGGGGGAGGCFSPDTLVKTQRGDVRFDELVIGDLVLTARGTWRPITAISSWDYSGPLWDVGCGYATPGHQIVDHDEWVRTDSVYTGTIEYKGKLMNMLVLAEPDDEPLSVGTEHSYTLANGIKAHNQVIAS